jgi:DNA-binding response OmpR family regulator
VLDGGPLAFVVDDEPAMLDIITFALQTQGFRCESFRSAQPAWNALQRTKPELIVLDVMLPGVDGVTLCGRIKAHWDIPVILLTAKGEAADRIAGLEADADDYIVKPFHPRELALRAQRLVKRSDDVAGVVTALGPMQLDPASVQLVLAGQRVPVTGNEYKVLAALMAQPGEPLDFTRLLIAGWGDPARLGGREMIKTAVYRLRHKLDAAVPESGQLIESVRGTGYLLRATRG